MSFFSVSYGNEIKENNDVTFYFQEKKNNLSFFKFKDVLKYKSDIQEHDIEKGKSYLTGKAYIEYDNTKIEADHIEFDWKNGDLYAQSKKNSVLLQKRNQQYLVNQLHLNLNNQIGDAKDFCIKEKDHIIVANKIYKKKEDFIMKEITYISDPFFLSKKDNFPDFYLKTNYLKYSYSKKYIFSGPVFFYWYKVPMPIFLPFFYMPIKSNKISFSYPKFQIYKKRIHMEDIGLFFPVSDFLNFRIYTSVHNTETWKIKTRIEYKDKLKHNYNGLIDFDYQNLSNQQKNYLFQWKHNSNYKSSSKISFNANINYDYDHVFSHNQNINYSYINIRKKLSNYLWFIDFYMTKNHIKKETRFIVPELFLHTKNILFHDEKNFFFNQIDIENKLHLKNYIDYFNCYRETYFHSSFKHNISMIGYFPLFSYLRGSSKILYEDFHIWSFPYFHISSFQNLYFSTNITSIPFYKVWKLKNNFLLKHQIQPILFFHMKYFSPFFYNVKNHYEKKINLVLNNDWITKNTWNRIDINNSFIIDHNFIKWNNFNVIGNIDLPNNLETNYKIGIKLDKEEKKMMYFDISFFSNYNINFFTIKNKFQKKGKNRYDYFFFDQKNYARYPIPLNLKIDFHSNYKNYFSKKNLFQVFLNFNGSVNITKYWKIDFNTNYNLLKNKIIFANIIFYRDLRSFEMSFNWTPISVENSSWSFFIGMKDPNLKNIIQYSVQN
ncbi:putative LPS assembly protein LptD [Blattabacterium cuenoti]|uniref:putative LPS assembly protein LptD n=1 Tax=Blattabacterium cuenoti TaxID=1653831 RepID=UPI00163D3229|nr:putative LPS assembly protein LptD [Blattabacterium cuenoti]